MQVSLHRESKETKLLEEDEKPEALLMELKEDKEQHKQ